MCAVGKFALVEWIELFLVLFSMLQEWIKGKWFLVRSKKLCNKLEQIEMVPGSFSIYSAQQHLMLDT